MYTGFTQFSQLYQLADVMTVIGPIDPLYYASMTVEGTSVWTIVDPGCSPTIMSFNLFQKIGQVVKIILASALQKPCRVNVYILGLKAMIILVFKCPFRFQTNSPNILSNSRSSKITVISGK